MLKTVRRKFLMALAGGVLVCGLLLQTLFWSTAVKAASAPNIIGYQGRVLNANGIPVTSSTISMIFELYTASSGGTCVWSNSSASCASATARTVTLTDGLFSEPLGDTSATYAAIGDTIFADNATLYLQVTVGGEALSPRKQILATPYALNSDTVDGLDADNDGSTAAAVVALGSAGNAIFTGNPSGSGVSAGSVYINPSSSDTAANDTIFGVADGGSVLFRVDKEGDVFLGAVALQDIGTTNSTSGASKLGIYDELDLSNGTNLQDVIDDIDAVVNGIVTGGAVSKWTDGGTFTYLSATGDDLVAGSSAVATAPFFFDVSAGQLDLGTDSTLAGTIRLYSVTAATSDPTLAADASGNLDLTAAAVELSGDLAVTGGDLTSTSGTFNFLDASGNSTTIEIGGVTTDLGNTVNIVTNSTTADTVTIGNSNAGTTLALTGGDDWSMAATGVLTLSASASATTAIVATDTDYTNALSIADNNIVGTTAAIDLTNFDVSTAGAITVAAGQGLDANGAGALALGNTNATSISLCNSAACDTLTLGTNADADTITIGESSDAVSIVGSNWSVTTAGLLTTAGDVVLTAGDLSVSTDQASVAGYFFNDGNLDSHQGLRVQGCLDTNPTSACNFITFQDGDGTTLGAIEGNGAGGVTNASSGSDYAELFPGVYSSFATGDVLGLSASGAVEKASNTTRLMGAFSIAPNTLGNWHDNWQDSGAYVPVALMGQVPVNVDTSAGAITVGDRLTLSSTPGVVTRLNGAGESLGVALESLPTGSDQIMVYVQVGWYGGDLLADNGSVASFDRDLALASLSAATIDAPAVDSHLLTLRGSAWDGATAQNVGLSLQNKVTNASSYRLSIANDSETEIGYFTHAGDLNVAGKIYPSDRGVLQDSAYIYYDSTGSGYMRTNAAGWSTGSYDFAEMFPSEDLLNPGDVVVFGSGKEQIKRSTGETYDDRIVGVVSTRPGFLAGEYRAGEYPVALAGRVPTKVTTENGAIATGDPLTTSTRSGYAMKATEPGPILGYAMESLSDPDGTVIAFIRASYYDGSGANQAPVAENSVSNLPNSVSTLNVTGSMTLNGGTLTSIGSMHGISNNWRLEEDGDFITRGRLVQLVSSYQGEEVETYAVTARETTVQLSGTATLQDGFAEVKFELVDPKFNDIISGLAPYRVLVTPSGVTGQLYVANRNSSGFAIHDNASSDGVLVDWLVIAYHKDYEPEVAGVTEEVVSPVLDVIEENLEPEVSEVLPEPGVESEVDEPALEIVNDDLIATPTDILSEPEPNLDVPEELVQPHDDLDSAQPPVEIDSALVEPTPQAPRVENTGI